ncbi:YwmB family TATA-box binding protein [Paenactinomyces guangxiensis]|uniref:YwmB family TATA-box binding protein n=1 Tax=Paenactinomyces guangxiensis TaxID=1490290 RepID=A0A7W1WTV9_9BACL|nr:YwmB family TATA-box binding protein [Paenactinomyces guangxiensis]MBA4495975.1 YwmB family TATA-box binding protein [Paenactinomyces guangxiensis]MBH8593038.1 YwmB family TATA-box binding protein [Paenactinomyces guangxiensis]
MKKLQLFQVGLWISLSLFLAGSHTDPSAESVLLRVFQSVGADPEQYVLHHGSRISKPVARAQMNTFVKRLQTSLQLMPVNRQVNKNAIQYTTSGRIGRNLTAELNVINDEPLRTWSQPYISIQVRGRGIPGQELARVRKQLVNVLHSNGIIPHFHFTIQGSQPLRSGLEQPIVQALKKLQASEVESMRTSHTVSISAHTPMLPGGLKTGGGLMNIQAAARVNHDTHRLIFTLGTPIITIEY